MPLKWQCRISYKFMSVFIYLPFFLAFYLLFAVAKVMWIYGLCTGMQPVVAQCVYNFQTCKTKSIDSIESLYQRPIFRWPSNRQIRSDVVCIHPSYLLHDNSVNQFTNHHQRYSRKLFSVEVFVRNSFGEDRIFLNSL